MNATMSNSTETELEYLNIDLNVLQKVVLVTIWMVIQVPGNLMLFGLIHFDKFGGDPLKRRMIDQVKQSDNFEFYRICAILQGYNVP